MKEFILEDMERRAQERNAQEATQMEQQVCPVHSESGYEQYFERINILLRDAESKAIAREQIGPLNPHIHTLDGPKWKVFIKRVVRKFIWWFIRPIVEQQSWYNVLSNAGNNDLRDSLCLLKELTEENCRLHTELESLRATYQSKIAEIDRRLAGMVDSQEGFRNTCQSEIAEINRRFAGMVDSQKRLRDACLNELGRTQAGLDDLHKKLSGAEEDVFDYIDYRAFEDEFRGSLKEIRTRIGRYLEYFKPGETVVDLGCGRGEWLELLVDKGIEAVGVDISESFVSMCRNKGLNVVMEDMFSYLEHQPDHSLDGITAIQVIEHITPAALAKLVGLCYRKLKLGGRVIFETQNPMSVSTLTSFFYVDPTHIRPVHPSWLEYLFKASSFTEITAEYPEYAWVTDGSIPALPGNDESTKLFNQRICYLNNFLYGSTDYAVIARK